MKNKFLILLLFSFFNNIRSEPIILGTIFGLEVGINIIYTGIIALAVNKIFPPDTAKPINKYIVAPGMVGKTIYDLNAREVKPKPGQPTVEDGYEAPKNYDGEKVPHKKTGQYGYPDNKGNIWVPANDHGGPHYDVVNNKGTHINIVPGGGERGQKDD